MYLLENYDDKHPKALHPYTYYEQSGSLAYSTTPIETTTHLYAGTCGRGSPLFPTVGRPSFSSSAVRHRPSQLLLQCTAAFGSGVLWSPTAGRSWYETVGILPQPPLHRDCVWSFSLTVYAYHRQSSLLLLRSTYACVPLRQLLPPPCSLSNAQGILVFVGLCRGFVAAASKYLFGVEFVYSGIYLPYFGEFDCTSCNNPVPSVLPELYGRESAPRDYLLLDFCARLAGFCFLTCCD